jgi:hypothetical protein
MTVRLTAFTKYDRLAASTRQRLLQYIPALQAAGIEVDHRPLLGDDYVASLVDDRRHSRSKVAAAYARRLCEVASGDLGDIVWVYAELFPYLPAAFERLLVRRSPPLVYDFDDAFFLPYDEHPNPAARALLGGKLEPLISAAAACTCGNAYLRDYAARFCPNSVIIPTVVDTAIYRPADAAIDRRGPVIGWIGSPSTWRYVRPLLPTLEQICRDHGARLRVVGAGKSAEADWFEGLELREWSEASEIVELQSMDIGIMPLPDEPWARGKSGYKLIQYMACGLPVVASPVGVNAEIVREDNGFLATTPDEWSQALDRLLSDARLRHEMGKRGRAYAEADYSFAAYAPKFVEVIKAAIGR